MDVLSGSNNMNQFQRYQPKQKRKNPTFQQRPNYALPVWSILFIGCMGNVWTSNLYNEDEGFLSF
jgi:hypothetical protein